MVGYYGLMHLAGLLDRRGIRRLADRVRRWIPLSRIELGISTLLRGLATRTHIAARFAPRRCLIRWIDLVN